jgi:hypothetical protein
MVDRLMAFVFAPALVLLVLVVLWVLLVLLVFVFGLAQAGITRVRHLHKVGC